MCYNFFPTVAVAHNADRMSQGEQFGQRRPPLPVTIKQILERYPDGQLFKVSFYDSNNELMCHQATKLRKQRAHTSCYANILTFYNNYV